MVTTPKEYAFHQFGRRVNTPGECSLGSISSRTLFGNSEISADLVRQDVGDLSVARNGFHRTGGWIHPQ